MTNFERIKAMTVEEMAGFISDIAKNCGFDYASHCSNCPDCYCEYEDFKKYLESEATE